MTEFISIAVESGCILFCLRHFGDLQFLLYCCFSHQAIFPKVCLALLKEFFKRRLTPISEAVLVESHHAFVMSIDGM